MYCDFWRWFELNLCESATCGNDIIEQPQRRSVQTPSSQRALTAKLTRGGFDIENAFGKPARHASAPQRVEDRKSQAPSSSEEMRSRAQNYRGEPVGDKDRPALDGDSESFSKSARVVRR